MGAYLAVLRTLEINLRPWFLIVIFFQKGILDITLIEELQKKNGIDITEQNEKWLVTGEISENSVMILILNRELVILTDSFCLLLEEIIIFLKKKEINSLYVLLP